MELLRSINEPRQRRAFVHRDVIGLIALDLVLRFIVRGMNRITLELNLGCDYFNNLAADAAGFRIPTDVITLVKPPLGNRISF